MSLLVDEHAYVQVLACVLHTFTKPQPSKTSGMFCNSVFVSPDKARKLACSCSFGNDTCHAKSLFQKGAGRHTYAKPAHGSHTDKHEPDKHESDKLESDKHESDRLESDKHESDRL